MFPEGVQKDAATSTPTARRCFCYENLLTFVRKDMRYEFTIIGVRNSLPGQHGWLLTALTAVLDSFMAGKSLISRFLLQALRWPSGLPTIMVGGSCLCVSLLCRLLDSVDQRLPPREKLLHLRYAPIRSGVVKYPLTVI